jgi:hexosaminidase
VALIHRIGWYIPIAIVLAAGTTAAGASIAEAPRFGTAETPVSVLARTVVPAPVFRVPGEGSFTLDSRSAVSASGDAAPVAEYLVGLLRPMTGLSIPLSGRGNIALVVEPGHPQGGYDLRVTASGIWLAANDAAGLFTGVQTLRQLLPPATPTPTRFGIAATTISDYPRFAYRGAMLDVARHFFPVSVVKRYIDDIALLKMNVLHLHLADDQGWRIAITGWPRLTQVGGAGEVGTGAGGFYTQDQYREIVAYAASRYITIVPEIDMPGHTNAALASYAELNCSGVARAPYHGTSVGFSSLCVDKPITWDFLKDVLTQLAELTPGPWIHIGGDESSATPLPDYLRFVKRVGAIVASTGKTVIGWHDIGRSGSLPEGTIPEYWDFTTPRPGSATFSRTLVKRDGKVLFAPANVAYLDQKYSLSERLGTTWAQAPLTLHEAYGWDPAKIVKDVGDEDILGVEAPLWSETFSTRKELEYLAFPRIVAIAEVGWTRQDARDYKDFVRRLGVFGVYLHSYGIEFKRVSGVPWR